MKLYDKETNGRFPHDEELGKHCSDNILGVSIIRFLHWRWKLSDERARLLSEELLRPEQLRHIDPDSMPEFNAIMELGRHRLAVEIKNAIYKTSGGFQAIPYKEVVSIVDTALEATK